MKSSGEARRAPSLPLRRPIYRLFRVTVAAGFLRAARQINRSGLGKHGRTDVDRAENRDRYRGDSGLPHRGKSGRYSWRVI